MQGIGKMVPLYMDFISIRFSIWYFMISENIFTFFFHTINVNQTIVYCLCQEYYVHWHKCQMTIGSHSHTNSHLGL